MKINLLFVKYCLVIIIYSSCSKGTLIQGEKEFLIINEMEYESEIKLKSRNYFVSYSNISNTKIGELNRLKLSELRIDLFADSNIYSRLHVYNKDKSDTLYNLPVSIFDQLYLYNEKYICGITSKVGVPNVIIFEIGKGFVYKKEFVINEYILDSNSYIEFALKFPEVISILKEEKSLEITDSCVYMSYNSRAYSLIEGSRQFLISSNFPVISNRLNVISIFLAKNGHGTYFNDFVENENPIKCINSNKKGEISNIVLQKMNGKLDTLQIH